MSMGLKLLSKDSKGIFKGWKQLLEYISKASSNSETQVLRRIIRY